MSKEKLRYGIWGIIKLSLEKYEPPEDADLKLYKKCALEIATNILAEMEWGDCNV